MLLSVLALLAAACGGDDRGFVKVDPPPVTVGPVTTIAPPVEQPRVPETSTTTIPGYQTQVVHTTTPVEVYFSPTVELASRTIPAQTILGTGTVLPVVGAGPSGWLKVSLPGRPNEATGWIKDSDLTLAVVDQEIVVDLATSTLTFYVQSEVVITTNVAIGSPDNPTPKGRFFVTDIVKLIDPTGPWGPYALGLSARSDTITEFNGGDGIIGIHGTNRPDRIGDPVSLGCVRVPNEIIAELAAQVQLGIPVTIR